jgi:hypothetical protein
MTELQNNKPEIQPSIKGNTLKIMAMFALLSVSSCSVETNEPKPETPAKTTIEQEQTVKCPNSWEMTGVKHGKTEWIDGGTDSLKTKDNNDDPRTTVQEWAESIKTDPSLLAYAANSIVSAAGKTNKEKFDPKELSDSGTCATNNALSAFESILNVIDSSKITFDNAPNNAINSFVINDSITTKNTLIEDRESIEVVLPNGNTLWINKKCANLITPAPTRIKPKPIKNTPKSNKTNEYKKPGNGSEKDSGKSDIPKAIINTPAESQPPKVNTTTTY